MSTKPTDVQKAQDGMQFELGGLFECPNCPTQSKLDGWVAAHWYEELVYTCPDCGTRIGLLEGEVTSVNSDDE